MLAAVSPDARLAGVRLVGHSEPIVLAGIPEAKIHAPIERHVGLDLTRADAGRDPDIISGATGTVVVIDDSILRSGIRVARRHPGRGPARAGRAGGDLDRPSTRPWPPSPPSATACGARPSSTASKPRERVLPVAGRGRYSFKGSGYVRSGIFDRIHLVQGDRSVRFRDRQHRRPGTLATENAPRLSEIDLFRIPADAGFNPNWCQNGFLLVLLVFLVWNAGAQLRWSTR